MQTPEPGFLRLPQILGDPRAEPPITPLIPVGRSCWWEGVRSGRFPRAIKLGPRITVWAAADIHAFIERARLQK